jgi:hypothetical protein
MKIKVYFGIHIRGMEENFFFLLPYFENYAIKIYHFKSNQVTEA